MGRRCSALKASSQPLHRSIHGDSYSKSLTRPLQAVRMYIVEVVDDGHV